VGRLGLELGRLESTSVVSREFQYCVSILKSSGWLRICSRRSWYSVLRPKMLGSVMGQEKFAGLTRACSWLTMLTSQTEVFYL